VQAVHYGRVLTVDETADLLRVCSSTVYRLLKTGKIQAFKLGRVWRFNLEDIDRWRLANTSPTGKRRPEQ
jgi:excisionase family DNA binding protein